jgi:hypothetical protein
MNTVANTVALGPLDNFRGRRKDLKAPPRVWSRPERSDLRIIISRTSKKNGRRTNNPKVPVLREEDEIRCVLTPHESTLERDI